MPKLQVQRLTSTDEWVRWVDCDDFEVAEASHIMIAGLNTRGGNWRVIDRSNGRVLVVAMVAS